ncbi:MAG: hypothetical protein ACR2PH_06435, partial [Desulfobulbia bacterium]
DDAEPGQTEYQTLYQPDEKESSDDDANKHTTVRAIAYAPKDHTQVAHVAATSEQALSLRRLVPERLKRPEVRLIVAVIIVVIVAGTMLSPGEISPEKERQQQLAGLFEKADKLISLDRYYAENATGALGVYQQILARDPGNAAATNGVKIVGQYYLLQAQQYLNDGDFSQARVSLEIVKSIDPGFPGLKIAEKRLDGVLSSDKKNLQIDLLLSQASVAMKKGFVYEPDKEAALFYYQNVLSLSPKNVTAKSGLLDILDILVARAQSALNQGDLEQAEAKVSLAESIDSDNPEIQELKHKINNAFSLDNVLTKADAAFANKYYTTPKNKNSYDLYKKALTIAPANRHAKQQLDKIAAYYAGKSRAHAQSGNLTSAQRNLEILETFFPDNADISSLKQEIKIKRKQIEASKKALDKQLTQPHIDASKKSGERQPDSMQINASRKAREKKLNPAEIDNATIAREK